MHGTMLWFVGGFLLLTLVLLGRRAYWLLQWKQSIGRLEQHEWTRTLASIRDHDR